MNRTRPMYARQKQANIMTSNIYSLVVALRFSSRALLFICLMIVGHTTVLAEQETGSPAIEASAPTFDDGAMSNQLEQEKPEWFGMSFLDLAIDIEESAAEGKHFGLYFYQDGCPYCEKLIDDNFGQYRINEYAKANFNIAPINIFGSVEVTDLDGIARPESAFSAHRKIQFTPTMIFFAPEGEVFRMNGYYPPHKFLTMLEYITEKYYFRNTTFIDFLQTKAPPAAADKMHYTADILSPPIDMTQDTLGSEKPVLVLFEQPRCLACDELHGDILKRDATTKLYRQFETVMVNVHGSGDITPAGGVNKITEKEWAREMDIEYTPSLVFFEKREGDQTLSEVFRVEGYMKEFHIQSAMSYVLSKAYNDTSQDFQDFIRARAEEMAAEEGHLDIMK